MSPSSPTFPLVPRNRVVGRSFGSMRSHRRGPSSDLAGSRPYRAGDDIRRIDWRRTARLSSASGSDEFVVREYLAEEAVEVVVAVDRSPRMGTFEHGLPWLSKPTAVLVSGSLIVDSALRARCRVGFIDASSGWRPPTDESDAWRIKEHDLACTRATAPDDALDRLVAELAELWRPAGNGAFLFLLSDFLVPPSEASWSEMLARGWDVIPVLIQDPTWEQSFPDVAGAVLPLYDPAGGRLFQVRLRRREIEHRRRENEARLEGIFRSFATLDLDAVLVSSADPGAVLDAFLGWSEARRRGLAHAR